MAISAIVDTDGRCGGISSPTTAGNDDTLADFSNFGSVVDFATPGVQQLSLRHQRTLLQRFS